MGEEAGSYAARMPGLSKTLSSASVSLTRERRDDPRHRRLRPFRRDARLFEVLGAVNERRSPAFPFYREDLDQITGPSPCGTKFSAATPAGGNQASSARSPAPSRSARFQPPARLLKPLSESHNHIAIVVDEFGGDEGALITPGGPVEDDSFARRSWTRRTMSAFTCVARLARLRPAGSGGKRARELGIDSDQPRNASPAFRERREPLRLRDFHFVA